MTTKTTWYAALFTSLALGAAPVHAAKFKADKVAPTKSTSTKGTKKVATKIAPVTKAAEKKFASPIPGVKVYSEFSTLRIPAESSKMLELPFEDFAEASAYEGSRDNIVFPAKNPGKAQKMVWLHGAGQKPNNLIIRRLQRAFAAEGLDLEIHSLEWDSYAHGGDKPRDRIGDIVKFIGEQKEPVILGGHSAGSGVAEMIAARAPRNIKAAILLNMANGHDSRVPTLQLKGSTDDMIYDTGLGSKNPLVTTVLIENSDHSLRYAPHGSHGPEKDINNRSENTWELNKLVAKRIKTFLGERK